MRGVNARGLDVRLRVPDWIINLEQEVKANTTSRFSRGSIQIGLKLSKKASDLPLSINGEALDGIVASLKAIERVAGDHKLTLSGVTALDLLNYKGVQETQSGVEDTTALKEALLADHESLLVAFTEMRAVEGAALHRVLSAQMDQIEALTRAAAQEAEARKGKVAETLKANLARILENSEGADADRVAQELALLAVKADVTEEIDRLYAHVEAARALLASEGPVGRKLDFLSQEFNREANTLCSKAQAVTLTRIGLDLKAVIDQMREQVQNVE
jgi:uncharacterized protein (TIGR00255 family)